MPPNAAACTPRSAAHLASCRLHQQFVVQQAVQPAAAGLQTGMCQAAVSGQL
jgi:hypothetical protein